jgi:hypothetical protein
MYVARMRRPGAARSTSAPKLEKEARASVESVALTVITSSYAAGMSSEASRALFPAATTTVTPAATVRQIAM